MQLDDGAAWADYVGVCAGTEVDGLNPAAYLPWVDVTIPAGEAATVELVLDIDEVERRLADLR